MLILSDSFLISIFITISSIASFCSFEYSFFFDGILWRLNAFALKRRCYAANGLVMGIKVSAKPPP